jgi:hypothetical protein
MTPDCPATAGVLKWNSIKSRTLKMLTSRLDHCGRNYAVVPEHALDAQLLAVAIDEKRKQVPAEIEDM